MEEGCVFAMGDMSEVVEGVSVGPLLCPHVLDIGTRLSCYGVAGAGVLGGEWLQLVGEESREGGHDCGGRGVVEWAGGGVVNGVAEGGADEGGKVLKVALVLQGLMEEGIRGTGGGGVVEEGDCSLEDVVEGGEDA
jgi:hypothetical protein